MVFAKPKEFIPDFRMEGLFYSSIRGLSGPISVNIYLERKSIKGASKDYFDVNSNIDSYLSYDTKTIKHFKRFMNSYVHYY